MHGRYVLLKIFLTGVLLAAAVESASFAQSAKPAGFSKAAIRDLHLVHFEIGQDIPTIGFSVTEIENWPDFIRSLQLGLGNLPFSREMKFLIESLIPTLVSLDEKKVIVSELNRSLIDSNFYTQLKSKAVFSETTEELHHVYLISKTEEDLKWLNRSIINDLVPASPKVEVSEGKKFTKLRNINCLTCHEAWNIEQVDPGRRRPGKLIQKTDYEILTEMISTQLIRPKPSSLPKPPKVTPNDEFIRNYENLKRFIIRQNLNGNPSLIAAVHPNDPYTFKPLLKRLVCLDCHAPGRDIDQIKHSDGKAHRIKFLYGPIEQTLNENHPY